MGDELSDDQLEQVIAGGAPRVPDFMKDPNTAKDSNIPERGASRELSEAELEDVIGGGAPHVPQFMRDQVARDQTPPSRDV